MTTKKNTVAEETQNSRMSRGELRRDAFLKAAREVFFEQGYESANMSEIVRRAGGSLATLYNQFGDKQGIFLAMLDSRVDSVSDAMVVELQSHAPIEEGLRRIGQQYGELLLLPESLETYRLLVGMAKKFPEVAHSFVQKGPNRMRQILSAYLEDRAKAGEISEGDYEARAALFLDMARSGIQTKALLDPSLEISQEEVRAAIDRATEVFLHGVAR